MGWAALMSDKYVCVCNGWIHASFSFVNKGGQVRVKKRQCSDSYKKTSNPSGGGTFFLFDTNSWDNLERQINGYQPLTPSNEMLTGPAVGGAVDRKSETDRF